MSDKTGIEWTDATWNPISGCSKVSAGCKNCYAERDWPRLSKNPSLKEYFGRAFTDLRCHPERLDQPLRWRRPRRIFVNSMSDLFHEDVPDDFIDDVFHTMFHAPQHTFLLLTKRPRRIYEYLDLARGWFENFYRNVWLGVSVEDQATAEARIPILLQTPAALRFLSVEPLLDRVTLDTWLDPCGYYCDHGEQYPEGHRPDRSPIDWVIVGGESGPRARPCDVDWVRSIVAQCSNARVPVFVKQLGSNPDFGADELRRDAGPFFDRHGGGPAEWPEDLRVREFPQ